LSRFTKVLASKLAKTAASSSETFANSASSNSCSSMASSIFCCAGVCGCFASFVLLFDGAAAICVVGNFIVLGFGGDGLAFGSFLASPACSSNLLCP
jgi:hypothetical protein